MKKSILIVLSLLSVIAFIGKDAGAEIFNFTIQGTYTGSDATLGIDVGDAFTITGSYDTSSQPEVLYYGDSGYSSMDDASMDYRPAGVDAYMTFDFSSVISLNYDLLSAISSTYNTYTQPFNTGDIADGTYQLTQSVGGTYGYMLGYNLWGLSDTDDYYNFSISYLTDYSYWSGLINYNYREVTTSNGDFTTVTWEYDTLGLGITDYEITSDSAPVPEPATLLLLGLGLTGLAGAGRKFIH